MERALTSVESAYGCRERLRVDFPTLTLSGILENAYGWIVGRARAMASLPADVRWPLLADNLGDPTAPGFPVQEFQTDPGSKYARSTDYRFHRRISKSHREIGVHEHRPLLLTGPADLPPTDDFIGSELCNQGLRWARSPLPDSWAYNAEWGPLFLHKKTLQ